MHKGELVKCQRCLHTAMGGIFLSRTQCATLNASRFHFPLSLSSFHLHSVEKCLFSFQTRHCAHQLGAYSVSLAFGGCKVDLLNLFLLKTVDYTLSAASNALQYCTAVSLLVILTNFQHYLKVYTTFSFKCMLQLNRKNSQIMDVTLL